MAIFTFKRTEIKYRISKEQYLRMLQFIENKMVEDKHGKVTVQSLYLDTDTNMLIRRSIEKPIYKEKIRLRGYNLVKPGDTCFLELKKKFEKIVYKRRIKITEEECFKWLETKEKQRDSQIGKEIDYFIKFYETLKPAMLLIYDRVAYVNKDLDLRITFDTNIRYRTNDLTLSKNLEGIKLLDDDSVIMEIKSSLAFPLWLVRKLSEEKIYKTSFSKYGTAYKKLLLEEKENIYV
jgi:hypothetical protein